jgi:hypothetical protein
MSVLRVKNWAEFQHYAKRRPPWIKLHHSLLDDYAWHRLPEASKALGPMLWLLASERVDGAVPYDLETIAFRLHMTRDKVDAALGPLIGAGFMIEEHDAGAPLAACQQPASSERERQRKSRRKSESGTRARTRRQPRFPRRSRRRPVRGAQAPDSPSRSPRIGSPAKATWRGRPRRGPT